MTLSFTLSPYTFGLHTDNPQVSSSEEEAGHQMVNISLFSTGPEVLHSFPATEMRDHQDLYSRYCGFVDCGNELISSSL